MSVKLTSSGSNRKAKYAAQFEITKRNKERRHIRRLKGFATPERRAELRKLKAERKKHDKDRGIPKQT